MTCYCSKCRASRERWRLANRDRINARRRELRAIKKKESTGDKKCPRCEIFLKGNNHGTKVYCRDCVNRFKKQLSRDRCRRYYKRKKDGIINT